MMLQAHLATLETSGLIHLAQLEPELEYLFRHALIQDAAYEAMLKADRRALHRAVGEALEHLYGERLDEYYGILAHHYQQAEIREKALNYLLKAADQARSRYANSDALRYYTEALAFLLPTDIAGQYAIHLAREAIYEIQGARAAQAEELSILNALANALADETRQADIWLRQTQYAEITGDYLLAQQLARQVIDWSQATGTATTEAAGRYQLGRVLLLQSEFTLAQEQLQQAIELARVTGRHNVEANCWRNLGEIAYELGQHAEARTCAELALQLVRVTGNRRSESSSLNTLGNIADQQGDYLAAHHYYGQALQLCREMGNRLGEGIVLNNLANVVKEQGDYLNAQEYYTQALTVSREVNNRAGESLALGNLGVIAADLGAYAQAWRYQEQTLTLCCQIGDRRGEARALVNLSEIAFFVGWDVQAYAYNEKALHIIGETQDAWLESEALIYLALLDHRRGNDLTALQAAQRALEIARTINARPQAAQAWAVLGHCLTRLKRWPEAIKAYKSSLAVYHQLNIAHRALEPAAGLVSVALAQGDLAQIQSQADAIVNQLTPAIMDGLEEPLGIYWICYRALQATDPPHASDVLQTAHAFLQERALRISDELMRQSFLNNVPPHHALLQAWTTQSPPSISTFRN